jgi:hypothetical protein
LANVDIPCPAIIGAHLVDALEAGFALEVRIAVSLTLSAGSAEPAVAVVAKWFSTGADIDTHIHLGFPAKVLTYVFSALELIARTLIVGVTVPFAVLARSAKGAVVFMPRRDRTLRNAHVRVFRETVIGSYSAGTNQAGLAFVSIVAVSLAFFAGSAEPTVVKIPRFYRTIGGALKTTDVNVVRPTIEVAKVTHADQVAVTLIVSVTIALTVVTGPAQGTVIVMALVYRTILCCRIILIRIQTDIYSAGETKFQTGVVHAEQASCTVILAVAVPFLRFAGSTQGTIIEVSRIDRALFF